MYHTINYVWDDDDNSRRVHISVNAHYRYSSPGTRDEPRDGAVIENEKFVVLSVTSTDHDGFRNVEYNFSPQVLEDFKRAYKNNSEIESMITNLFYRQLESE